MDIVEKARIFQIAAHSAVKQVRKYTGEPYWVHPIEVANILIEYPCTDAMLAAAMLHDTIEDTGVTINIIEQEFGSVIADYVFWLTDQSTAEDGNRAIRKKKDADRLAQAPREVQQVKLCDLISNTKSIVEHDENFAKIYLKEKAYLLSVMTKVNDSPLYLRALLNVASI